jgi:hypothetical protein
MSDKVTIYKEKLATVLAYLAAHIPEGKRDHDEWFRCVQILAAQREEPEAQIDDAAGKCGSCELRGNCDEDTMPGGCPKYVGKQTATWHSPGHYTTDAGNTSNTATWSELPTSCNVAGCIICHPTPPPQYAPAAVAFPAYVTRDELDVAVARLQAKYEEVQCENADMAKQVRELDEDQVELSKCYIYHLREHMPEALRNAGEIAPKSKSCQTCHHFAVCDDIRQGKCESWEGHPK